MYLHEIISKFEEIEVLRDAKFDKLGFINTKGINNLLIYLNDIKYIKEIDQNCSVAAVITTAEIGKKLINDTKYGVAVSDKPDRMFYLIHNYLCKETDFYKKVNVSTQIGSDCCIAPNAYIAENNVIIGNNVVIENGAIINENTIIGNNCVIGSNTNIGTRGFQYYRNQDDIFYVEHIGGTRIGDNVEILSGSCIASGLLIPTIISKNTKIDNLVHIGHSAFLDERVLVTAGVVIGGSAHIGKRVWLGINSVISPSICLGDDAFVCMGAVVSKNVAEGKKVSGNFAIEHKKQIEFIKSIC